jgi:protein SCO1/2
MANTTRSAARGLQLVAFVLLALLSIGAGVWLGNRLLETPIPPPPPDISATVLPTPRPIGAFHLLDQYHKPFDESRLRGHWSFVFFGYTHCPDVCPTALATLASVYRGLGDVPELKADTQVVFVSVDPQRDTPDQLAAYVSYFDTDFIGATGPEAQLKPLTTRLGIVYARVPGESPADYLVDHSAAILLFDPQARLYALFSAPHDAATMGADYRKLRAHAGD